MILLGGQLQLQCNKLAQPKLEICIKILTKSRIAYISCIQEYFNVKLSYRIGAGASCKTEQDTYGTPQLCQTLQSDNVQLVVQYNGYLRIHVRI